MNNTSKQKTNKNSNNIKLGPILANSLINQKSLINKSLLFNSSDSSFFSTKITGSKSFLFKSLHDNNDIQKFQLNHFRIKKKHLSSSTKDIKNNSFQNYMKSKILSNITNLKLPIMNKFDFNKTKYCSEPKYLILNQSLTCKNFNTDTSKNTSNNDNCTNCMSLIEMKLRDELYDKYKSNYNRIATRKYNQNYNFKESTKKRILIRKFIYEKEKNYQQKLVNYNNYKNIIFDKEKKITTFYNKITQEDTNKVSAYIDFLKKKINEMKDENLEINKKIETLKKDIKDIFIKIKVESDKLWVLFDIRNFLICVKETISIKKLPLYFRVYNSDYIDELSKLSDSDIYYLEKLEKKEKKNINLFRIPTNLIVYIKAKNSIVAENIDKRFIKYINIENKIFNSVDEFIEKYNFVEKEMLFSLGNAMKNKFDYEHKKLKSMKQITEMEEQYKTFENEFNKTNKIHFESKKINDNNNKFYRTLCSFNKKNETTEKKEEKKVDKQVEKELEFKNNENFLKILQKKFDMEKNQFLFKFNELKNQKKYKNEIEYVYYFIYTNILKLWKICPEYFNRQNQFCLKKMNLYINNIKNIHKFPEEIIKSNILYLLTIYENAITIFLLDYKNDIRKYHSTEFYIQLHKDLTYNKKSLLFRKQRVMDKKIEKMKYEKYNQQQFRYRYKKRNIIYFNNPNKNDRLKSFNKGHIKEKDNSYEEKNLLSY